MKNIRTSALIPLALLMLITISSPSLVKAGGGPIIWSEERQLTFDPTITYEVDGKNITEYFIDEDVMPSITATRDKKIWIAWRTDETENYEIFYKIYNLETGQWTNDTRLTFNPNIDSDPAILQTLDNKIWVFWASSRTGNYDIFYKTTADNGASWSTETQVTSDTRSDESPAVTQTSDGTIWLVWSRPTTNNTDIFYKTYDGTTWTVDTPLTTNMNDDYLPSVIQAKNGKIWIFWSRNLTDTHTQIYCMSFNGSTWSSETQLTTEPKDNLDPAAFVEKDGTIRVFWQSKEQHGQANFDLWHTFSLDNGTTWYHTTQGPIQFTTDRSEDIQPSATQAPDRSLWVIWTSTRLDSNRNSNVDLYYRVSILGDVNHDGIVDTLDLYLIEKAMATTPAWPWGTGWDQWNPECDLNNDNTVDIEDMVTAIVNYGKHV